MFLKNLKKKPQKTLFLELATLIMMAEGSQSTTSEKIQKLESKSKSYIFFQNIDENEINVLNAYAEELEVENIDGLFSLNSTADAEAVAIAMRHFRQNIFEQSEKDRRDIEAAINSNGFKLMTVLEEQTASTLSEYSRLDDFKKEVMSNIFSSGEDVLNINPAMIERFMLDTPIMKQDILKRTVKELVAVKQETIERFESKEKKIILFELIGAGYSSGHFGDDEKSLLIYICELLSIENEYIEEFLEVSERLFAINKDLAILINE